MKNNIPPTEGEKEQLQQQIGLLKDEDHLFLFTEIIQNMDRKCYTITENCTLFDLNDLDPESFWKMVYHARIFLENNKRCKEIEEAQRERQNIDERLSQKMEADLPHFRNIDEATVPSDSVSGYEKLRIEALQQCSYSNYGPSVITMMTDSKSVYSDNCHRKWKQNTKSDEIAKKVTRISARNNIRMNERNEPFYQDDETGGTQTASSFQEPDDKDEDDEDDHLRSIDEMDLKKQIEQVKRKPKITLRSQTIDSLENYVPAGDTENPLMERSSRGY